MSIEVLHLSKSFDQSLAMMVDQNTTSHETPFTVSVDLLGNGCTTGISAGDRSKTIKALVDFNTKPTDLGRPGHIFTQLIKPNHYVFNYCRNRPLFSRTRYW